MRTQNPCEHPVDHLSTLITVPVPADGGEMLSPDPFCLKRRQYLLQPIGHSRGALPSQRLLTLAHSRDLAAGKCPGLTEIHPLRTGALSIAI